MKDPNWIEHFGGNCPCQPDTIVTVKYRSNAEKTDRAGDFRWNHIEAGGDILGYRFVTDGSPYRPQPDIHDPVHHPKHYTNHPSGVECIQITEHMGFCLGNAVKYIWRADLKLDALEDLKKARWYIDREIEKRESLPVSA